MDQRRFHEWVDADTNPARLLNRGHDRLTARAAPGGEWIRRSDDLDSITSAIVAGMTTDDTGLSTC